MPSVGERKRTTMGNMSKSPMYAYAAAFCDAQQNILRESSIDYGFEPIRALTVPSNRDALERFFVENSVIGNRDYMSAEEYEDQITMMKEAFINDLQAVQENATASLSTWNPMVGISLPMHKYLMLNCVFAQAVPRYVAKSPSWTETMETRFMITPEGERIDIANQQNQIFRAWKSANMPKHVAIGLPESNSIDILATYFGVPRTDHNLSVATHIEAVLVEGSYEEGDNIAVAAASTTPEENTFAIIGEEGKFETKPATGAGSGYVWKPWVAEFTPGYGEYNRIIAQPVDMVIKNASGVEESFHDVLFASHKDNLFEINSGGKIKAVQLYARYDSSTRMLKTNRVEWQERTTFVQIPENDGITIPITPEEVKDIGAQYGINQVTKYMSMIKDILENVKDDDIHEQLDESFLRLDDDHKLQKTIDFAPRPGYYSDHLEWLQKTFMNTLDQYVTGLITVLRDPNMQICIIGRPGLIRQITPVEYSYSTPSSIGPIELDFHKTVVTSDKRVYNFLSSDKLFGNDNLIVLLIPKNTDRIIYRLYDYQMYISNEIRDAQNPALPALTAFQRYKFFAYQEVQGRLFVANPTGLREHLPNVAPIDSQYTNNDLGSVYTHYDPSTGLNVTTPNTL